VAPVELVAPVGGEKHQDVAAQLACPFGQLGGEARLSDPGLPGKQDEASIASVHRQERVLELGQLLLPSDEHGGENPLQHPWILPGRVWDGDHLARVRVRPPRSASRFDPGV